MSNALAWHPFAEVFPLLEGDDYEELKASIKSTGGNKEHPIIFRMAGGKMQGLDGRNRYRAIKELRLKPTMKRVSCKDDEVEALILRHNVARRHLNGDYRKAVVIELRKLGQSTRQIAETLGTSQATVRNDLAGEQNCSPEGVKGRDGKNYKPKAEAVGDASEEAIVCPRCQRVGAVADCPKCKALNERAAQKRAARKAGPKNGQLPFDLRPFNDHFGGLLRQIDALGKRYGRKESPEAEKLRDDLGRFKTAWANWHKSLTKVTA